MSSPHPQLVACHAYNNNVTKTEQIYAWLNAGTFNPADGCRHPQDIIAAANDCSVRTVIRCVQQLEREGRLTVDRPRRRGACNTYHVTDWNHAKRADVLAELKRVRPAVLAARRGGCHPKGTPTAPRAQTPAENPEQVVHSCGRARQNRRTERKRMSEEAIRRLRATLEGRNRRIRGRDHDFMAQCPAHDDAKESLHVWHRGDGAAVYCHAGCVTGDVVAALGLGMSDLFDGAPKRRSEIVATYDYTDETGGLLYQTVRYQPKDFRQRRPDGRGGWVWNLRDTRRVLYRLPRVVDTASNSGTVYVVEGEKDVHAVENAGVTATTNVGGAAKWRREYGQSLRGAHVVIVADRDTAGIAHARRVRTMLSGVAVSRRIVCPVEGKDSHDHLQAGYALAAMEPIDGLERNAEGWVPCPWCGQPLAEETDGSHCGGCAITWWGSR